MWMIEPASFSEELVDGHFGSQHASIWIPRMSQRRVDDEHGTCAETLQSNDSESCHPHPNITIFGDVGQPEGISGEMEQKRR
jgi:hypothetical protein